MEAKEQSYENREVGKMRDRGKQIQRWYAKNIERKKERKTERKKERKKEREKEKERERVKRIFHFRK